MRSPTFPLGLGVSFNPYSGLIWPPNLDLLSPINSDVPAAPIVPPTLPTLAGQGWSVKKTPNWSTIVAPHVSGREVRVSNYVFPLYDFELVFNALNSDGSYLGVGTQSLQTLMGFYAQMMGKFGQFLFTDTTDNSAVQQTLGVGNGAATTFTFGRALATGAPIEPVGWVTSLSTVYLNGVAQSYGWSWATPNSLIFANPPANGVTVAATFAYSFLCRFSEDALEFEQFMNNLWMLKSCKFQSVRNS